jgi:hypothetical protein
VADLTMSIDGDDATQDDRATVPVKVSWKVAGMDWTYHTSVHLRGIDDTWRIVWSPATLHPKLRAGDQLAITSTQAKRASILDGGGAELVKERPVVVVGIEPRRVTNQAQLLSGLSIAFKQAKVNVSITDLPGRLAAAKPDAFVEVVALRREVYDQIRSQIRDLPGTVFREERLMLAPTRQFARALLGTVGPVRADQIAKSGAATRWVTGRWSACRAVRRATERHQGRRVSYAWRRSAAAEELSAATWSRASDTDDAGPAGPIAADNALAGHRQRSALVAIRVARGAVPRWPTDRTGELVPPPVCRRSTFKVVSA